MVGAYPESPTVAEETNLAALALIAPVRAVLPSGAGALSCTAFAAMSAAAFETHWVHGLV